LANISLKDNIYAYLNGQASLTSLLDTGGIGWGQMPETATSKRMIVYSMLNDNRLDDSKLRNQLWRFWICFPNTGTAPKAKALAAGLKMLDLLHEVKGSFGSTNILFSHNVSNQDPFFDTVSNCWIVIQDYNLKMRTLQ
jgi:hypothetical protein